MPIAAVPPSPAANAAPPVMPRHPSPAPVVVAGDSILTWFRGEFAAANAIIDALCGHLAEFGEGSEYEAVFSAVHRRRLNWIPILQMQKYHSIADVALELRRVAEKKSSSSSTPSAATEQEIKKCTENESMIEKEGVHENSIGVNGDDGGEVVVGGGGGGEEEEDSPDNDIVDPGK